MAMVRLAKMVEDRYYLWKHGLGAEIETGKHTFVSLEKMKVTHKGVTAPNQCGRHEMRRTTSTA